MKNWTHKVKKEQRGSDGKWYRYPTAFTGDFAACKEYAAKFAQEQKGVAGTRIIVLTRNGDLCSKYDVTI